MKGKKGQKKKRIPIQRLISIPLKIEAGSFHVQYDIFFKFQVRVPKLGKLDGLISST